MFRVTCTPPGADEILPERPETAIDDGYGLAFPLVGIVIAAGLLKTDGRHPGGGVGVGVLTGVGAGVGVGVGTTVGVGVGATAPQHDLELTVTVSTRHPVPETLESDAIRKRSRMGCPAAAAGRLTVVVTNAACVPVHACLPAIGLAKEALIGPV